MVKLPRLRSPKRYIYTLPGFQVELLNGEQICGGDIDIGPRSTTILNCTKAALGVAVFSRALSRKE